MGDCHYETKLHSLNLLYDFKRHTVHVLCLLVFFVFFYLHRSWDQAWERSPHCSYTRSCPLSWCSGSRSLRSWWCTHRYLQTEDTVTQISVLSQIVSHLHVRKFRNYRNSLCVLRAERFAPLTNAALSVGCGLVTSVTGALVGSWQVDTLSVLAQVFTQLALVHIWTNKQVWRITHQDIKSVVQQLKK